MFRGPQVLTLQPRDAGENHVIIPLIFLMETHGPEGKLTPGTIYRVDSSIRVDREDNDPLIYAEVMVDGWTRMLRLIQREEKNATR